MNSEYHIFELEHETEELMATYDNEQEACNVAKNLQRLTGNIIKVCKFDANDKETICAEYYTSAPF